MVNRLQRALMRLERQSRVPRLWSNRALAQIGTLFDGDVCNVSAWKDEDKEGRHYRDYFPHARSYTTSNLKADSVRGAQADEIEIDLEQPLPPDFDGRFDVVFNHTTLEHLYDVHTAVRNLCRLTRDIVIVVAPFLQMVHYTETYADYWRFTPLVLQRLFRDNGLEVVFCAFTDEPNAAVYILAVASKQPERWRGRLPAWSADWNMVVGAKAVRSPWLFLFTLARRLGYVE